MAEIQVRTAGGDYRVYIGHLLYENNLADIIENERVEKLVIVSQPPVVELYLDRMIGALQNSLGKDVETSVFIFPEGEANKNIKTLTDGYNYLLEHRTCREDALLAFGGGVVGDLGGFLAASFMRGISYLQIPTTLMAMVDSSIGGKVGVDLPGAKNAIGAFYQPKAVLCDLDVLQTLPERELKSGMAEIAKYGFLYDQALLEKTNKTINGPPKENQEFTGIISRCVELKAMVVQKDERDLSGERAILNYGHTFGHALESSTNYRLLRHGEAIAVGMMMAARAAELAGLAQDGLSEIHRSILKPLVKGVHLSDDLALDEIINNMKTDKKRGRKLRFVLLKELQKPCLEDSLPDKVIRKAISETIEELRWIK
jgi:3-dehydroquinate synthase